MGRASASRKRIACPPAVERITSRSPSVSRTPITSSPSLSRMAMMPDGRGLAYSSSAVFFTTPCLVAKSTQKPGWNSRTVRNADTFSSLPSDSKLTIALPRAARPACGISCTLIQYSLPLVVKTRM